MLVVGGGIIGLEMGTVYSTLGARLDVVEMLDGLMLGADRDLVKVWQKMNAPRFDKVMLKTKTVGAEATKDGILVKFEGEAAPKEPQLYDMVLQAVGRIAERQAHRCREGGRARRRSRLHSGRRADAHQRAAHLRDRRHRRPADAGAQGGARGARGRRGCGGREGRVRCARDPERGLHRPGDRLGRAHRGRSEGARHQAQEGPVPVDSVRPRHRQRSRRGLHETAVRCREPSHRRRRHRRHACRAT